MWSLACSILICSGSPPPFTRSSIPSTRSTYCCTAGGSCAPCGNRRSRSGWTVETNSAVSAGESTKSGSADTVDTPATRSNGTGSVADAEFHIRGLRCSPRATSSVTRLGRPTGRGRLQSPAHGDKSSTARRSFFMMDSRQRWNAWISPSIAPSQLPSGRVRRRLWKSTHLCEEPACRPLERRPTSF